MFIWVYICACWWVFLCARLLSMSYSSYSAAKIIESMRDCLSVDSPPYRPLFFLHTKYNTLIYVQFAITNKRRLPNPFFSRLYAGHTHVCRVCMHTVWIASRVCARAPALCDFFAKILYTHTIYIELESNVRKPRPFALFVCIFSLCLLFRI